jgi:hypothetical protein
MFQSSLALLLLAVLAVLSLPAMWMLCEVALDLPPLGLAVAAACGVAIYVMEPHVGLSLVDASIGLMALAGGVLIMCSFGGLLRWGLRRREPALPIARVVR